MMLDAFMMKAVLWVPSSSPLNVYRITLVTAGLDVGTHEMYELSVNRYELTLFLDCSCLDLSCPQVSSRNHTAVVGDDICDAL